MPIVQHRGLTLLDVMILIAALAIGFVWWSFIEDASDITDQFFGSSLWGRAKVIMARAFGLYAPLIPLALSQIVIRLRSPRPPLRRVSRQPGFAASCAAIVALIVLSVQYVAMVFHTPGSKGFFVELFSRSRWSHFLSWGIGFGDLILPTTSAIGSVWLVLALGRALRPERSWVDRFGCLLAGSWLLLYAFRLMTLQAAD